MKNWPKRLEPSTATPKAADIVARWNPILRGKSQHYFFVQLSDFADTYIKLDDKTGKFAKESEQRAFPVVFVYDHEAGSLDVYAKGGKRKIITPLQEIFGRVILEAELPKEDGTVDPYRLSGLLKRFDFPVDPADGIDHVRLRRLRVSVKGNKKRRVQLEANPDGNADDIYDMLGKYLNQKNLPEAVLDVDQVTLCFLLRHDGNGRPPKFSFNVSHPNTCDLKSKREEQRVLGEKYLKRWNIDCA